MGTTLNNDDFFSLCKKLEFIKIRSIEGVTEVNKYPITGSREVKVDVELDTSKLKLQSTLKLNVGGSKYIPKNDQLIRKVGNHINIQELLECFSEPERLTQ